MFELVLLVRNEVIRRANLNKWNSRFILLLYIPALVIVIIFCKIIHFGSCRIVTIVRKHAMARVKVIAQRYFIIRLDILRNGYLEFESFLNKWIGSYAEMR